MLYELYILPLLQFWRSISQLLGLGMRNLVVKEGCCMLFVSSCHSILEFLNHAQYINGCRETAGTPTSARHLSFFHVLVKNKGPDSVVTFYMKHLHRPPYGGPFSMPPYGTFICPLPEELWDPFLPMPMTSTLEISATEGGGHQQEDWGPPCSVWFLLAIGCCTAMCQGSTM